MPRRKDPARKMCWGCRKRAARLPRGFNPVVCSVACGFVMLCANAHLWAWCKTHRSWHPSNVRCGACQAADYDRMQAEREGRRSATPT